MNKGGEIYNKYCNGDVLSDEEISSGIKIYKDIADSCILGGNVFKLAFTEANRIYLALSDMKEARLKRNK